MGRTQSFNKIHPRFIYFFTTSNDLRRLLFTEISHVFEKAIITRSLAKDSYLLFKTKNKKLLNVITSKDEVIML